MPRAIVIRGSAFPRPTRPPGSQLVILGSLPHHHGTGAPGGRRALSAVGGTQRTGIGLLDHVLAQRSAITPQRGGRLRLAGGVYRRRETSVKSGLRMAPAIAPEGGLCFEFVLAWPRLASLLPYRWEVRAALAPKPS